MYQLLYSVICDLVRIPVLIACFFLCRFFKGIRSIEQQAERTSRELDIRSDLRRWDEEFPWIHHELVIRYVVGGLASTTVMFLYNTLRGGNKERRR